ncbi:unnamed protein product, partial [Rotaria magnacalcarata]
MGGFKRGASTPGVEVKNSPGGTATFGVCKLFFESFDCSPLLLPAPFDLAPVSGAHLVGAGGGVAHSSGGPPRPKNCNSALIE